MNIYSFLSLLSSILCISVSLVSIYTRKTKSHYALALIMFLIAIWASFPFVATIVEGEIVRLYLVRCLYVAAAFVPFAFLFLTLSVLSSPISSFEKLLVKVCFAYSCLVSVLSFHSDFIRGVGMSGGARFPIPGNLFPLFISYFIFVCGWVFWRLLREYPRATGIERNQYLYFFGAFILAYVSGGIHFFSAYWEKEPFPHDLLLPVFTVILGYAILRFRLMDFNLIVRWGVAFSVTIAVFGLFLFGGVIFVERVLSQFLKIDSTVPLVLIACSFVLIFDPIRRNVSKIVDRFIFKSPDFQGIFSGFEKVLSQSNSVEDISRGISLEFGKIWNLRHAGLMVLEQSTSEYVPRPIEKFRSYPIANSEVQVGQSDFLVKTLQSERRLFKYGIVIEAEVNQLAQKVSPGERVSFEKVKRTLRWVGAAACVPLMVGDVLVGFIVLGPKLDGGIYNDEDKKFLSHVAERINLVIKSFLIRNLNESPVRNPS